MAVIEGCVGYAGLLEIRAELQKRNEEIAIIWEKWEEAIVKLQGFDSEIANVRAQILSTTQELDNKLSVHEALL